MIGVVWILLQPVEKPEAALLSASGLHWHATLALRLNGESVTIPANIGLAGGHNPIHTHDVSGTVHLEFPRVVTEDNLRLKKFFQAWGEEFNNVCLLNVCVEEGDVVMMRVNGELNTEYGEYVMRDGDRIELSIE